MRKESILGLASAAVALPAIFSGCRGQEATRPEQDFSKYIPLVVSVEPSRDICTDSSELTYQTGDHIALLKLSDSGIIDFEISVEDQVALFGLLRIFQNQ